MRRSAREYLTIYLSGIAAVFDELAKLAAPPRPSVHFQSREEVDASFTEGDYSGKRPGFIP